MTTLKKRVSRLFYDGQKWVNWTKDKTSYNCKIIQAFVSDLVLVFVCINNVPSNPVSLNTILSFQSFSLDLEIHGRRRNDDDNNNKMMMKDCSPFFFVNYNKTVMQQMPPLFSKLQIILRQLYKALLSST